MFPRRNTTLICALNRRCNKSVSASKLARVCAHIGANCMCSLHCAVPSVEATKRYTSWQKIKKTAWQGGSRSGLCSAEKKWSLDLKSETTFLTPTLVGSLRSSFVQRIFFPNSKGTIINEYFHTATLLEYWIDSKKTNVFKQLFNTVAYQSKNVFSYHTLYPIHFNEEGDRQ